MVDWAHMPHKALEVLLAVAAAALVDVALLRACDVDRESGSDNAVAVLVIEISCGVDDRLHHARTDNEVAKGFLVITLGGPAANQLV